MTTHRITGPSWSEIGKEAALAAQRTTLLAFLEATAWNLSQTGSLLRMGGTTQVLAALEKVGLMETYRKRREKGLSKWGGRRPRRAVTTVRERTIRVRVLVPS